MELRRQLPPSPGNGTINADWAMDEPSHSRTDLQAIRMELRKAVRFVHADRHPHPLGGLESPVNMREDEVNSLADRLMEQALRSSASDESNHQQGQHNVGLTIMTNHGESMSELSQQLRSASFSEGSRPRMVPCSPPVPIPQSHLKRRSSASTAARSVTASLLIPTHEHQYSRSQCEARLWDEYWNYKLSLESRESFEASRSNQQAEASESSINDTNKSKSRAESEASTDDTTRDSSDEVGDRGDINVFDMDDF